jgi:putative flavoprotein involved in K+ transport
VHTETEVVSVQPAIDGYRVITNQGEWHTRALVIASGACNLPAVPALAAHLPASVQQVTPRGYRNPEQLEDGGVLVIGASATGLQLAEEIQLSGRPVTLAVGEHVRLPRTYRGLDIQWWMDVIGLLDEGLDAVDDVARVRGLASPQLIGSDERRTLDLNALTSLGVNLVGRLAGIRDRRAQFSGSLRNLCALADLKMNRLLDSIDDWIDAHGYIADDTPAERPAPTRVDERPALGLDLGSGEIRSVVWATGYRPDYSWLDLPVLDRKGRLRHHGGVVDAPGIYALGLPFMRRRKSTFIHGAGDDAREISENLRAYLDLQSHMRLAG